MLSSFSQNLTLSSDKKSVLATLAKEFLIFDAIQFIFLIRKNNRKWKNWSGLGMYFLIALFHDFLVKKTFFRNKTDIVGPTLYFISSVIMLKPFRLKFNQERGSNSWELLDNTFFFRLKNDTLIKLIKLSSAINNSQLINRW